jgi:hydroxymethylglutaryl-CoA reductase
MGNFINSCLEQFAKTLKEESQTYGLFPNQKRHYGNHEYPFQLRTELHHTCRGFLSRDRISRKNILNPQDFAERFVQAVQIAE